MPSRKTKAIPRIDQVDMIDLILLFVLICKGVRNKQLDDIIGCHLLLGHAHPLKVYTFQDYRCNHRHGWSFWLGLIS